MKEELSGIDVYHLVEELREFEGGKIQKVYEWDDEEAFLFRLYAKGKKNQLRVVLPGLAYLTKKRLKAPKMPPGFCRFLRKHVQGGWIEEIKQKKCDRIIDIKLSTRHGERTLIIELLKPSNIVVLDHEQNIIHPYKKQKFKHREIKSRHPYTSPQLKPDISEKSFEELDELLTTDQTLGRALATTCGLGGTYADEIIHRTKTTHDTTYTELSEQHKKQIYKGIQKLFTEKNPCVTENGEVFPVQMQSKEVKETYNTFSEAIDSQYTFAQVKKSSPRKSSKNKWKAIINAQEKQVKQFEEQIEQNQKKAEWIYQHYQKVKTLLDELNKARKQGKIQQVIEEHDYIKEYDPENKEVTIHVK